MQKWHGHRDSGVTTLETVEYDKNSARRLDDIIRHVRIVDGSINEKTSPTCRFPNQYKFSLGNRVRGDFYHFAPCKYTSDTYRTLVGCGRGI